MSTLHYATAPQLAQMIRERKISSRELLELYLSRIAAHNPAVNAVVTLDEAGARAAALAADEELATRGPRGPLHGLPITLKDAYETAGMRTTAGAKPWADHVPTSNAVAVQRVVDAGAFVIGKTNTPAYCGDVQSYNDIFGVTRNPHALERTPGGSSGGAAVALACGFTAFEIGSDIGGSIRTPCNWTGVYGHKPSFGIVPQRGHLPAAPGNLSECDLSVCGPMGRSASDLALLLPLLAGPDRLQAKGYRLELPKPRGKALRDYRIGVWLEDETFPIDAEVLSVLEQIVQVLEQAGARVDRSARPERKLVDMFNDYYALLNPCLVGGMSSRVLAQIDALAKTPEQNPFTVFARTATAPHYEWIRINERRERDRMMWERFFERYDVLLCPVSGSAAIEHVHEGTPVTRTLTIDGVTRPYLDLMAWISMATAAYLPASVAPVGRTASGLPVGVQIIGPYLEDLTTIDVAGHIGELTCGFVPPAGF